MNGINSTHTGTGRQHLALQEAQEAEDDSIVDAEHARERSALAGRHFASPQEMARLFKEYPQALANSRYIAEECDVELPLHKPIFPAVNLGRQGGNESAYSRLWKLCFAGVTHLYKPLNEAVITRLKYELEVIEELGFSPYFLVVQDIARFARRKGIPIMARGSAANSLAAYVLGITQVDPLAHGLLFERFLNRSRADLGPLRGNAPVDLPDIDLDLCWRRRDEVLHYVYSKYGHDHVAIVGTHITFRLRSAWREMAKAVGISPERINRVAARLPHLFSAEDLLEERVPELAGLEGLELGARGLGSGANREDSEQGLEDSADVETVDQQLTTSPTPSTPKLRTWKSALLIIQPDMLLR